MSRYSAFLRGEYRDPANLLSADAGWTRLEQVGAEKEGNWLLHLNLVRQSGSTSRLGLRYRKEYADTGGYLLPSAPIFFSGGGTISDVPTLGSAIVNHNPYYLEQVDLYHHRTAGMFPWSIQYYYRDTDFTLLDEDREEVGGSVSVRYAITGTMMLQLLGTYQRTIYWQTVNPDDIPRKDRDSSVGAVLTYRLTPHLQAGLEARRFDRRSTWIDSGYSDDRFAVTLTYYNSPVRR